MFRLSSRLMPSARTIGNRLAPPRFLLFLALLIGGFAAGVTQLPPVAALLMAFDLAAAAFLLSCLPLFNDKPDAMRKAARENDANRIVLLIVSVILSLVILVTVVSELAAIKQAPAWKAALVVATLALAWTFANLVYALHYAHLFYSGTDGGEDLAGLDFPGQRPEPDYADFVYFSFTLGIALQTSDVCVTSPHIRRIVTGHCVAAFIYNLGVLALAVNVIGAR